MLSTEQYNKYLQDVAQYLKCGLPKKRYKIVISDQDFSISNAYNRNFGVKYVDDTLILTKNQHYHKGILLREAFWAFIPDSAKTVPEIKDLAWEYARTRLKANEKEIWSSIWKKVIRVKRTASFLYNPPKLFPLMTKFSKGAFLSKIYYQIVAYDRYGIALDKKEYYHIIQQLSLNMHYPLSSEDIQIITALYNNPDKSLRWISKNTNIPYRKLIQKMKFYKQYEIVSKKNVIVLEKIGFSGYILIIRGIHSKDARTILRTNPFIYLYSRIIDGHGGFYCILFIPKNKYNIASIKHFVELLSEQYDVTFLPLTYRTVSNFNFQYYNTDTNSWEIPWSAWFKCFQSKIDSGEFQIPNKALYYSKYDTETTEAIDSIDIKILNYLDLCDIPLVKLRRYLNMNMNTLIEHIKKLENMGILRKFILFNNIGLNDVVFVIFSANKVVASAFVSMLDELPKHVTSFSVISDDQYVVSTIITLPSHITTYFVKKLRENLEDKVYSLEITHFEPTINKAFQIPVDLWDDKNKRWLPYSWSSEEATVNRRKYKNEC